MTVLKIIKNWVVFLLILSAVVLPFWLWRPIDWHLPALPTMTGVQAVAFGFACAFMWVEVWHLGNRKPFNCLKCMCGWFTMFIALTFHVQFWYMYLPLGVTVGAIFEGIKMRHL